MDNIEKIWNKRLADCMKKKGYTQQSFSNAFNAKYNTASTRITQSDVSRWLDVGGERSKNRKSKGFPSYQNMIKIADFFGVSVGYLTGETDYDSFQAEKVSNYTHLDNTSIKKLLGMTESSSIVTDIILPVQESRAIVNKFISSESLPHILNCLHNIEETIDEYRHSIDLSDRFDKDAIDQAYACYKSPIDFSLDPDAPKLNDNVREAYIAIDQAIDRQGELSYQIKVYLYEALSSFNELVSELYPEAETIRKMG